MLHVKRELRGLSKGMITRTYYLPTLLFLLCPVIYVFVKYLLFMICDKFFFSMEVSKAKYDTVKM